MSSKANASSYSSYDPAGRRTATQDSQGTASGQTSKDTVLAYDHDGNVVSRQTDGYLPVGGGSYVGGKTTTFGYDPLDRVTQIAVNPVSGASRTTSLAYWPSGDLATRTNQDGVAQKDFYLSTGELGRMQRTAADGSSLKDQSYSYDGDGNRASDERGGEAYDSRDRLVYWQRAMSRPAGGTHVVYDLGGSGAPTHTNDTSTPSTDTNYAYVPGTDRIDHVDTTVPGQPAQGAKYSYDSFGDVSRVAYTVGGQPPTQGPSATANTYDGFGRLIKVTGPKPGSSTGASVSDSFTYDALDRRLTKTEDNGPQTVFSYVADSPLVSQTAGDKVANYDYDPRGQRIGHETPAGGYRSYGLDANGSVESGNKHFYDFEANQFAGLPNSLAKQVARNPDVPRATATGGRYLGVPGG